MSQVLEIKKWFFFGHAWDVKNRCLKNGSFTKDRVNLKKLEIKMNSFINPGNTDHYLDSELSLQRFKKFIWGTEKRLVKS